MGIDPGWGNDVLPALVAGLGGTIERIRCQEIFHYSTDDQPDAVRFLARALGVELGEIREVVERRELGAAVTTDLGDLDAGTQGANRGMGVSSQSTRRFPDHPWLCWSPSPLSRLRRFYSVRFPAKARIRQRVLSRETIDVDGDGRPDSVWISTTDGFTTVGLRTAAGGGSAIP